MKRIAGERAHRRLTIESLRWANSAGPAAEDENQERACRRSGAGKHAVTGRLAELRRAATSTTTAGRRRASVGATTAHRRGKRRKRVQSIQRRRGVLKRAGN
jgi:hypothetical protein